MRETRLRTRRATVAFAAIGLMLTTPLLTACLGEMNANTSCSDFLHASLADQDQAVSSVAADLHAGSAVTPLGRPDINYICANSPSKTLGDAVRMTG